MLIKDGYGDCGCHMVERGICTACAIRKWERKGVIEEEIAKYPNVQELDNVLTFFDSKRKIESFEKEIEYLHKDMRVLRTQIYEFISWCHMMLDKNGIKEK
jgi:hypothetical protein